MATGRVPTTANSPLTAKGDLFGYSTTQARVAVGNDGETLVADSSTTTGLRYQGSIAGGRNALINGGFDFSQRGTGAIAGNGYTLDRWFLDTYGTSVNGLTAQIKTDAAQTGFTNYARIAAGSTSGTNINFSQSLETSEVRKFQGKAITVSFRYKVPVNFSAVWTAYVYYSTNTDQAITNFAASGATLLTSKQLTNTTSWTFDSLTGTLPSNATSMCVMFSTGNNMIATAQFDVAQVQLELGSVPTTFSRAGGTIQGELAACQRYYEKSYSTTTNPGTSTETDLIAASLNAAAATTSNVGMGLTFKVSKRVAPTLTIYDGAGTSGKCSRLVLFSAPTNNQTVAASNTGTNGSLVYSSGSSSAQGIGFHYTADAEL